MEVNWTNSAKNDLIDYYKNSMLLSEKRINDYITSLVEYVDNLKLNPRLGKLLFKPNNNIEVRQVIYKMHRILYSISDVKINVLIVYHMSRDSKRIVKYIKEKL